jgi:hypothetical protein
MIRGIKKPRVRMKNIERNRTQKLSGFFDYLTKPGQAKSDGMPDVYTNIEDNSSAGIKAFLDQYEKNFEEAMTTKKFRHNTKLVAKSMVFVLPYEMTKKEVDGYVQAVTKVLPEYMTFAFALHCGSHKKTAESWKNLHLQGFLGIRGDGSEKPSWEDRQALHDNLIKASDDYIKSLGFRIRYDNVATKPRKQSLQFLEGEAMRAALDEGVTGNRDVKSRQSELLRDPLWLFAFSQRQDVADERLKQFCAECAQKRIRIDAEKFATTAGSYGLNFEKQLTNALSKKVKAQSGKSKLMTAQCKIVLRPKQNIASASNSNSEKNESDAVTYQPLTEDMLKAALNECKKSTSNNIMRL